MTRLGRAVALLLCLVLASCGVSPERRPVTIDVPVPTQEPAAPQPAPKGPRPVTVYFIRDDRLAPTDRSAPDATAQSALDLLDAGPAPQEARSGLRTALTPASAAITDIDPDRGVVVLEVTSEFTATAGANQLLAVAQVVWTVTEAPGTRQVRITSNGKDIEIPTDRGLSTGPVARDDYRTVAPLRDDGAAGRGRPR